MSGGQERLANSGWRWRNSAWIIVPPLSLGVLTWAAFLYAGTRARRRFWLLAAGGYFVAFVVGLVAVPPQEEFGIRGAITMLLWVIICWIGGTVHAILIRPEYLRTVAASRPWFQDDVSTGGARRAIDQQLPAVTGDAAHILGVDEERARLVAPGDAPPQQSGTPPKGSPPPPQRTQAPPPAERSEPLPPHPGEGSGSTSQAAASGADRVPLNSAGEEALAALPGLDPILAKRIVVERHRRGGFDAVEELAECGVPPHVVVRLRSVVDVVRGTSQHHPRERRGRTLDL